MHGARSHLSGWSGVLRAAAPGGPVWGAGGGEQAGLCVVKPEACQSGGMGSLWMEGGRQAGRAVAPGRAGEAAEEKSCSFFAQACSSPRSGFLCSVSPSLPPGKQQRRKPETSRDTGWLNGPQMTQLASLTSIARCDPACHQCPGRRKGLLVSLRIKEASQVTISRTWGSY